MKYVFSALILFATIFCTAAAELPESLKNLQEEIADKLKIISVDDDDFEDENDNEFFVLKVRSSQDERATDIMPVMRVTVKLFDKKTKTTVFAQTTEKSRKLPAEGYYGGSTEWEFLIPFGEMKKPKLEALAIEFGVMESGTFVPGASEYDDVEGADEILNGEGTKVEITCPKGAVHERNDSN